VVQASCSLSRVSFPCVVVKRLRSQPGSARVESRMGASLPPWKRACGEEQERHASSLQERGSKGIGLAMERELGFKGEPAKEAAQGRRGGGQERELV